MPAISKIRLTNVVYEHGLKRYHDELFLFDGVNGAIVLENGGGKSVFIQTVLQAIIPHTDVGERKVKDTLVLDEGPAHIAIEWLLNERPRRYVVTAVTLYKKMNELQSLRYVYEYGENDSHSIERIPFVRGEGKTKRPSSRGEMADYYSYMAGQSRNAKTFPDSIKSFREYIEKEFHIIADEWESIARINGAEGDVEAFFENCKKTNELIDRLLIPTVEQASRFKKNTFADMFENHQEQFKKYKVLKEKIEENKALSSELALYVEQFQKVDEKEKQYAQVRRKAKSYQIYLTEELENIAENLGQLEEALMEWREQKECLEMKKDSLTIHQERNKLKELKETERRIQVRLNELEDALRQCKHEKYSLLYAQAREEILKEQGNIEFCKRELEKSERQDEVEDLILELEQVNGQIHYLFLALKEQLEKQIKDVEMEFHQLGKEKQSLLKEKDHVEESLKEWQERKTKAEAHNEQITKQIKTLKSQLVAHENESVEELLELWMKERQKLDEEKIATEKKLKSLGPQIQKEKERKQHILHQLMDKHSMLSKLLEQKKQMDEKHQKILKLLAETLPQWSYMENVYSRQSSISNQLEERITQWQRKKENLLEEERRAKRFVDDYGEQNQFFADPYIEKQILKWNQFDYLITGIEYLQSIEEDGAFNTSQYPFWALTLITTEKEKEDLLEKLKGIQHKLTYPIFVLSSIEAMKIVKGEARYEEVVEPAIWQMNQYPKGFAEWKTQIIEEADRKEFERKEAEKALQIWEKTQEQFRAFLAENPQERFLEMERMIQECSHEIQNLKEQDQQLKNTIEELEKEFNTKQSALRMIERKLQDLEDRLIPKAMDYIKLVKEQKYLKHQLASAEQEIQKIDGQLAQLVRKLQMQERDLETKRDAISRLKLSVDYEIEKNDLYKTVKYFRIVQTNVNMEALKLQRQHLNDKINQIQVSRSEWLKSMENSKKRIEDLEKQQHRFKIEYKQLDENYPFPIHGEEKIEQLFLQSKELERELEDVTALRNQANTEKEVQASRVDQLIFQFNKKFPQKEVFEFADALTKVEEQLEEEEKELQKRFHYLMQQQRQLEKEQKISLGLKQQLEKYELVHRLDDPNLKRLDLSEEEKQQFPYQREAIIFQMIRELEEKQKATAEEWSRLNHAKNEFKKFCHQLTDPKLRKVATEGIDMKSSFEEIFSYQQQLEETIIRTNQIAEVAIKDYDEEQQQFIHHIHTHLRNVRNDLQDIQNKTKVKVGDKWKTIYEIQVPDWDEEEGKTKIRGYLDWILSQIEKESFLNEHGQKDAAKVRQFLEKTLQTVPLLREVIGNQSMKVKCRKVESDQHISNTYYTWEQSNQWSGGEKWSKNMALFLGVLNFIAEKSQPKQSNAKRHRTVILDNPFGKASSDHVLSPVFFIAEQLGFQIIALTAHAEGKFLSDYFPIIYSCKLRHLEGGANQVVTKEKQVQRAYLRDYAPESLERLGEKEQLSLFD